MQVLKQSFMVMSILEDQRLVVYGRITTPQSVCSDSVAKVFFHFVKGGTFSIFCAIPAWSQLKHCRVGQTVRVTSDVSRLRQVHSSNNWRESMVTVSFYIGHVFCLSNVELFLILVCIPFLDSWSDWTCD